MRSTDDEDKAKEIGVNLMLWLSYQDYSTRIKEIAHCNVLGIDEEELDELRNKRNSRVANRKGKEGKRKPS